MRALVPRGARESVEATFVQLRATGQLPRKYDVVRVTGRAPTTIVASCSTGPVQARVFCANGTWHYTKRSTSHHLLDAEGCRRLAECFYMLSSCREFLSFHVYLPLPDAPVAWPIPLAHFLPENTNAGPVCVGALVGAYTLVERLEREEDLARVARRVLCGLNLEYYTLQYQANAIYEFIVGECRYERDRCVCGPVVKWEQWEQWLAQVECLSRSDTDDDDASAGLTRDAHDTMLTRPVQDDTCSVGRALDAGAEPGARALKKARMAQPGSPEAEVDVSLHSPSSPPLMDGAQTQGPPSATIERVSEDNVSVGLFVKREFDGRFGVVFELSGDRQCRVVFEGNTEAADIAMDELCVSSNDGSFVGFVKLWKKKEFADNQYARNAKGEFCMIVSRNMDDNADSDNVYNILRADGTITTRRASLRMGGPTSFLTPSPRRLHGPRACRRLGRGVVRHTEILLPCWHQGSTHRRARWHRGGYRASAPGTDSGGDVVRSARFGAPLHSHLQGGGPCVQCEVEVAGHHYWYTCCWAARVSRVLPVSGCWTFHL